MASIEETFYLLT